jgi:anti-sigma factor RsiW
MTCCELTQLLLDFLDGTLADEQRRQVEEHLGKCPPCVVYVETYQITIRLSRRLPCAELPDHLRRRCEELLRHEAGGG